MMKIGFHSLLMKGLTSHSLLKSPQMALYLFQEMPASIWSPQDPDMLLLRQWLLNFDLTTTENQLARLVLERMNWDVFSEVRKIVLCISTVKIACLISIQRQEKKRICYGEAIENSFYYSWKISFEDPSQSMYNWHKCSKRCKDKDNWLTFRLVMQTVIRKLAAIMSFPHCRQESLCLTYACTDKWHYFWLRATSSMSLRGKPAFL